MRIYKVLGFVGTMFITILFLGAASVFAKNSGVLSGNSVNVRQEPSTSSTILKTITKGTQMELSAVSGMFFKVNLDGIGGAYVAHEYISVVTAEGKTNTSSVNIRSLPSMDGQILGQARTGEVFEVTGISDEWYAIKYNSKTAYIYKDLLDGMFLPYVAKTSVQSTAIQSAAQASASAASATSPANASAQTAGQCNYVIVTAEAGLNFRGGPSQDRDVICVIPSGEAAELLDGQGIWYKIFYDGKEGYIFSDFTEKKYGVLPEPKKAPIYPEKTVPTVSTVLEEQSVPVAASPKAIEIIAYAKQFIGTPYAYGGTDLTSGVDCSGFTYSVMKRFGINLYRTSRDQINNGPKVERSDLQPGDLVFFNTGGNSQISHVGIYISGGQFIHAGSGQNKGVMISSLDEDYYNRMYCGACRVL